MALLCENSPEHMIYSESLKKRLICLHFLIRNWRSCICVIYIKCQTPNSLIWFAFILILLFFLFNYEHVLHPILRAPRVHSWHPLPYVSVYKWELMHNLLVSIFIVT